MTQVRADNAERRYLWIATLGNLTVGGVGMIFTADAKWGAPESLEELGETP